MFGFFKKKEKKIKTNTKEEEKLEYTENEIEKMSDEIKHIQSSIESCSNIDEKAKLYEKMGILQAKLEKTDEAIDSLESSLQIKLSIGEGYKKLMSLYNKKRAEAAKCKDDANINFYMNKMDEMRQIAKKVTISGN